MKKIALTAFATLIAGTAFAADLPRKATPLAPMIAAPMPVSSWTGLYGGLAVGYGAGQFRTLTAPTTSTNMTGFLGSARLGYDMQFDNFVAGVVAEYTFSNIRGSDGLGNSAINTYDASLRARLGVLANRDLLIYATGGLALGNTKLTGALNESNANLGWTLGLGGEYKFDRNWSAFGEYRYTKYNKVSFTGPINGELYHNTIRFGANYRF
jgi:outer membrane immunogenic protein